MLLGPIGTFIYTHYVLRMETIYLITLYYHLSLIDSKSPPILPLILDQSTKSAPPNVTPQSPVKILSFPY